MKTAATLICCFLFFAGAFSSVYQTTFVPSSFGRSCLSKVQRAKSSRMTMMAWTPDKAPASNPLRAGLTADASFDRVDTRPLDYIDNDAQNPPLEGKWWHAYLPTEEEKQAAAAGFDFTNPDQWLKDYKEGKIKVDASTPADFKYKLSFKA